MIKWLCAALLVFLIIAMTLPRMVSDDPARWHVDPETAQPSDRPNSTLIAGHDAVFLPMPPEAAMMRVDAVALADARTARLAGSPGDGHATYIQRSAIFGFPDYISVTARAADGGSLLSIYSRSRFGHSDLGANKARIERWLGSIEAR